MLGSSKATKQLASEMTSGNSRATAAQAYFPWSWDIVLIGCVRSRNETELDRQYSETIRSSAGSCLNSGTPGFPSGIVAESRVFYPTLQATRLRAKNKQPFLQ